MRLSPTEKLINDARAAGVTDQPLQPLIELNRNADRIIADHENWEHPGHVQALFTATSAPTPKQIQDAAAKDAAAVAAHAEVDRAVDGMEATLHQHATRLFEDGAADEILDELSDLFHTSETFLLDLQSKWGTRTPDANTVVARGDGDDLDKVREAPKHRARLQAIDTLLSHHYVDDGSGAGRTARFTALFIGSHARTTSKRYKWKATDWFLDGENITLKSLQDARRDLNQFQADREQREYREARADHHSQNQLQHEFKDIEFKPKFTIDKEKHDVDKVRFRANGMPADTSVLITHQAHMKATRMRPAADANGMIQNKSAEANAAERAREHAAAVQHERANAALQGRPATV